MPNATELNLRETPDGTVLPVKAVPGSSRDKITGIYGDALKVATSAPPEKGKANKAIAKTLAKALGHSAGSVHIVGGLSNPRKEFLFEGIGKADLLEKLNCI